MLCKRTREQGWVETKPSLACAREQGHVETSENDIYEGEMPWLKGTLLMPPLIHVEHAGVLSLPSSSFLIFFLFSPFSFFHLSSFFSPFLLVSLFLSLSFSFPLFFFFFFEQGRPCTIGMDGSYHEMLSNLPHTWTFEFSRHQKSSVRCWCLL
jgi:hypothetical protein